MKKIGALILTLLLVLSLTACGSSGESNQNTETPKDNTETSTGNEDPVKDTSGEGDLGDYHVKITGFALAKDYEDKDAIIVNYDYTNNSADATSAEIALYFKAFQDGVELEHAYMLSGDAYDSANGMKDIKTGVTLSCQTAFELTSTSEVEIEVSELISFSSKTVTTTFSVAP